MASQGGTCGVGEAGEPLAHCDGWAFLAPGSCGKVSGQPALPTVAGGATGRAIKYGTRTVPSNTRGWILVPLPPWLAELPAL